MISEHDLSDRELALVLGDRPVDSLPKAALERFKTLFSTISGAEGVKTLGQAMQIGRAAATSGVPGGVGLAQEIHSIVRQSV